MIGVRKSFSEELKRGVVLEIESGHLSIREAAYETLAGVSQVKNWFPGKISRNRGIGSLVFSFFRRHGLLLLGLT